MRTYFLNPISLEKTILVLKMICRNTTDLIIRLLRPDGIYGILTFKAPFVLFYKTKQIRKGMAYKILFLISYLLFFLQGTCQLSVESDFKGFKGDGSHCTCTLFGTISFSFLPQPHLFFFLSIFIPNFVCRQTLPNKPRKEKTKQILLIGNFTWAPPGFCCPS